MRLLFLTPQRPFPPRQGTALRNWGLIQHLAARGHEVWLLSFDPHPDHPPAPALRAACREIHLFPTPRRTTRQRLRTLMSSPLPDMAWRLWDTRFLEALRAWVRANTFDVVQVEGIELARYMLHAQADAPRTRWVFDDHNCEYVLQQRAFFTDVRSPRRWHAALYSLIQWQRLRAFEQQAMQRAALTVCVSAEDEAALRRIAPCAPLLMIPNGIAVADYAHFGSSHSEEEAYTLVFTGKMDFRPNVDAALWFAAHIWPRVKAAQPRARWWIVGQSPSPRLDPLRADPSIVITGAVEDVRPFIARAAVYVAPLRVGGGTRFKLLEAMAMRKAIVSTSLGCEGFAVRSGEALIVADTPHDFAQAILALFDDVPRRRALGERAFQFVAAHYDWAHLVPRLEAAYFSLCRAHPDADHC